MSQTPVSNSSIQSTPQMSSTDGYLVTRSGQHLARAPFMKSDSFPFLKLPSEIRNMVYRYALAQGANTSHCGHDSGVIPIVNMQPSYYEKHKNRKEIRSRTPYQANVGIRCCCDCPREWEVETTTYDLSRHSTLPASGLLTANKQIADELMPIFYGENTFVFDDLATVVPFLQDRSMIARQHIRSIRLDIELLYNDNHHLDRQVEWIKALRYISRHLDLSELGVYVVDMTYRWWAPAKTCGQKKAWLRVLTEINNLKTLDFFIEYGGRATYREELLDGVEDEDDAEWLMEEFNNWMVENETGYRKYLRERMIKKKQTRLDNWLLQHDCSAKCSETQQGRMAQRRGLPKSGTRGLWTLPEVDVDALYYQDSTDEFDDEEYGDHSSDVDKSGGVPATEVICHHAPNIAESSL
ncbi:MAG: hypothetical protein Q9202_004266 [Teloschistes flavicans]